MPRLHLVHVWDYECDDTETVWILSHNLNDYLNKIHAAIVECESFSLNACKLNVQLISDNPSRELLKGIALVATAENQVFWIKTVDTPADTPDLISFECLQTASELYDKAQQLDIEDSMQQIDEAIQQA